MGHGHSRDDAKRYRDGYPGKGDDMSINVNALFYQNKMRSVPDGDFIDKIHTNWWGDYSELEAHHGYIQWLFPIRESGMNSMSQELQPHEIAVITGDPAALARLIKSYELMLDFYGLKLKDPQTGEVERTDGYLSRFRNLNYSSHNYLRITRILKCLGEFGLEHLKKPLVVHFIKECFVEKALPNIQESLVNYWVPVLRNDSERIELTEVLKTFGVSADDDERPRRFNASDSGDDDDSDEEEARTGPRRSVPVSQYSSDAPFGVGAASRQFQVTDTSAPAPAPQPRDEDGLTAPPRPMDQTE